MDAVTSARALLRANIQQAAPGLSAEQVEELVEQEWSKLGDDPCADIRARKARRKAEQDSAPGVQSPRGTTGGRTVRRDFSGKEV